MVVADNASLPLAVHAASASPHEVSLVGETLAEVLTAERPARLIGDKAYDSDPLDEELALQAPLEGRAAERMASELPPRGDAL